MQTDATSLVSNTNGNSLATLPDDQPSQFHEAFDWSSEFEANDGSR
jgi:hypothetical protein